MASLTLKNTALILGSMLIGGALTAALYARWAPTHSAAPAAEQQRKVLFWYDPMYPNTRFDKPGKSPFMDMDLVPKYADEESSASGVRIDPTQTQNLGVKTATVTRGPLTFAQSFPANVSYNEYQYAIVQARAAARDQHIDVFIHLQHFAHQRAIRALDSLYRGGRQTALLQRLLDHLHRGGVGAPGLFPAAQDRRVAGFQTQGGDVDRHVRTRFINHANHPQRHATTLKDRKSVV